MRGRILCLAAGAALLVALPAAAALQPVRQGRGETRLPVLRAGTVSIPAGHASGRVRVIVQLREPPLAAHARELAGRVVRRRLDVRSASSRVYLRQLARAQRLAELHLRRAIPSARVTRRFRVVLNGLTVSVPVRRLPQLVRLDFLERVYPSLSYALDLNRSPSLIGAPQLQALTGARGDGVKIGVVDDGVDAQNPFFNPAGYAYPAGFPRGEPQFTTAKVIVARAFPGPGSGRGGRLPVDRQFSFHGTHVAGIAAGNANTTAPPGVDHPTVTGLSGVAPRAWIGNYRVFNVPTPVGHVANTPEIVAAFEAAVSDGMDVINFSGGGPMTDPFNDAMFETIRNVAAAGVVPVIAGGNDREEFGFGTVGTPGVAPDAISVAATSNLHVFAPALRVTNADAPDWLREIPFVAGANEPQIPAGWASTPQRLVDVGTVVAFGGRGVDRKLCGTGPDPDDVRSNPLPAGSLSGVLALVSRGTCTFLSKAVRAQAAGASGIVIVDNREGEANPLPIALPIPGGMISNLDGARLRAYLATGASVQVLIGRSPLELVTGRGGIVTSFSSAGPTAYGHLLKPDVSAPGSHILSSTLPEFAGSPFAVFDGTSMATPHVAGAAALLVQRHPNWSAQQVKSALVSTAGPAFGDTARTTEASVLLEGGGLVNVQRADTPLLFTTPVSLSFGDVNANRGAQSESLLVRLSDAGGGEGAWSVELRPQSATAGASVVAPPIVDVPPGGETELPVRVRVAAGASTGDDYGFVVLHRGAETRRVPYYFAVTRPGLEAKPAEELRPVQEGDTRTGQNAASVYRFPTHPFGPPPDYVGPPMNEDGAEHLYTTLISDPVYNFGVATWLGSVGALVDPWLLGSKDENDVQGYGGTPVNVNSLTFNYRFDVGAAGAVFPRSKRYYVSVDSGRELFSGESLAGAYLLRAWINDVAPPRVTPIVRRLTAGRSAFAIHVRDTGSGVDPSSLILAYRNVLLAAAAYDQASGIAIFLLPAEAPPFPAGRTRATLVAADFQEAKNLTTPGGAILPNTRFVPLTIRGVRGPAVSWLLPRANACVARSERLLVLASATRPIREVRFFHRGKRIRTIRRGLEGLYATTWSTAGAKRGTHRLTAVVVDAAGRKASAVRNVRVCARRGR